MNKVTGGSLPAQLWGRVMRRGLEGLPQRPLPGGGGELVAQAEQDDSISGFIGRILKGLTASASSDSAPHPTAAGRRPPRGQANPSGQPEAQPRPQGLRVGKDVVGTFRPR